MTQTTNKPTKKHEMSFSASTKVPIGNNTAKYQTGLSKIHVTLFCDHHGNISLRNPIITV